MASSEDNQIRRLDMSLLVVFDLLMRRGKMSAVGEELGLTQSAVSHAVQRLREIFGDPLFVRRGPGVEPTARARQLHGPVGEALNAVRAAVRLGRRFDPASASRAFSIAALDSIIAAVAPPLLKTMGESTPGCRIVFRTFGRADAEAAVLDGLVDLAVGVFPTPPVGTVIHPLGREEFRVVARRGHPRLAEGLDLDTYCALDHILVSPSGDPRGSLDLVLERIGRSRRILAVMPQFISALMAVGRSDAILTAPKRVCCRIAPLFDLEVYAAPVAIPGFEIAALGLSVTAGDPAILWLMARLREALDEGA